MRESFRIICVGLSLLIVAGCSDSSTSPSAPATRSLSASSPSFDYSGGQSWGDDNDNFTISPNGGSYSVNGLFNVNFPAGSVCDPDLSSYGEGQWNNSCVTLTRGIRITATVRVTSAGVAVDFQPALRFAPDKQVTISTDIFAPAIRANREYFSRNPSALRPLAMYYSPFLGANRVADYISDPSLVTHVDLRTGKVWRRIKHFSGYSATTGQPCNPADGDPDCIEVDGRDF
jgi:hypothetical protein